MRRWIVPACLVLAVDLYVLAGVARNRSGEPEAVVELTERELALPWWSFGPRREENSGLELELRYQSIPWSAQEPSWFDAGVLGQLGFDVSYPVDGPDAETHYRRVPPRRAFVVLEMDGPAWQELHARPDHPEVHLNSSRLVLVGSGLDPVELRSRFPDRSRDLIFGAEVRPVRLISTGKTTVLRGTVSALLVRSLNVPRPQRILLEELLAAAHAKTGAEGPTEERAPRYAVTVKVGRRLEPWIDSVRPLP
jgi:hypothetical protein